MKVSPSSRRSSSSKLHDLGLDRDVERRRRLVEHQQARVQRQRPRDADPLPLSAAELVGHPLHLAGVEVDQLQQASHLGVQLLTLHARGGRRAARR